MKPPACPVDEDVRRWVEARMLWLAQEFGEDRLRRVTVVTPTTEFFPAHWDGTEEEATALAARLAGYMGLDFGAIEVYPYDVPPPAMQEMGTTHAAGLYEAEDGRFYVGYDAAALADPLQLAATFAHELAHVHLLGHGRVVGDEPDHEPLTDLCTVFFGVGILNANTGVIEQNLRTGHIEMWRMGRLGYLDLRTFGYAFAVFAHLRREEKPTWSKHLRSDVRAAMKQGLKRLAAVGVDPAAGPNAYVLPEALRRAATASPSDDTEPATVDREDAEAEDIESSEAPDDVWTCDYCGAGVNPAEFADDFDDDEAIACDECRASIDEIEADPPMMSDRVEKASKTWNGFIVACLAAMFLFVLAKMALSFR